MAVDDQSLKKMGFIIQRIDHFRKKKYMTYKVIRWKTDGTEEILRLVKKDMEPRTKEKDE